VGLDTICAVSSYGAQAFVWLVFLGVFFFLPYAALTAELGSAFPEEGGPYVWTKLAMGRFAGSMNAVMYWLSNPIWLGGALTITAYEVFTEFFFDPASMGAAGERTVQITFGIVFIWIATWSAILSFGVGKWIPTIGAWVRVLLLGGFTLTVVVYAIQHGVQGVPGGEFKPTTAVFFAAIPVLFFNYVGFELPNAAGDEMTDPQKDVPVTIRRAWFVAILAYGAPILAILMVLPKEQITSLGGFVDAIKTVFTVYGGDVQTASDGTLQANLTGAGSVLGHLAAIGFIWALLSSGATWIMGADRAQAVAAYDGGGPRWLGMFSTRFGTPIAVNFLSGAIATIFMILAFTLSSGNTAKYFSAALGLAISTTTLSYLGIFPALYLLRKRYSHVPRPFKIPGGDAVALLVSLVCWIWALIASLELLFPGLLSRVFMGTPMSEALVGGDFEGQRAQYELSQLVPLGLILLLGLYFYWAGRETRSHAVRIDLSQRGALADPVTPAD